MPREARHTFIRQLRETTAYKGDVTVRSVVDETIGRIAGLPEQGTGELLRQEICTLRDLVMPLLQGTKAPKRRERKGEAINPKEAETIIGADHFFGAEAVRKAFPGVPLKPEQIPAIPFSREDLQRAKELGDSLRLRVNKAPGNGKLNMKRMQELLQPTFDQKNEGKVLYDTDWYESEDFFMEEPELCWVLTSDGIIPDSEDKDYLQQTEHIAEYLRDTVYQGRKIPQQYADAIKEVNSQKDEIRRLIDNGDWQEAAEKLANLKLNKITRRIPVEVLYDMLVTFQNGDKRHLEDFYDWTPVRSSDGGLVDVGRFAPDGVGVNDWRPNDSDGALGVVLARKF
ncbi:hypothetical protein A3D88_04405 [Candidatus Peribacteria bacterium RIFCSPHIGHO2_02_FULL_52_16]|nr:MAG: hypothetical protein A2706_03035 [Candidatus Peribacteria bacterium RIFCSPHIGHO2_01_FULL_51_35]OGJ60851.1 MAG: hypothetical protein A3D88_04405 [Candidatus Peribacteria bacterium RIFCSPHIGHO2_02_FULL_52_16]